MYVHQKLLKYRTVEVISTSLTLEERGVTEQRRLGDQSRGKINKWFNKCKNK